ncbi:MAG: hypothetical protein JW991_00420, partial [Candidatus Pacebacteria bacterium]|nr:hypothetical protein [Candidatus Paceibacterota bacterium]
FLIGTGAFCLRWLPTFWAWLKRGERVFLGVYNLRNVEDIWSHWAAMYQGRAGRLLFTNPYGPEVQGRFLIYLPYLLLGRLSRLINISLETAYFLASLFLTLALALAIFKFSRLFFKNRRWCLLAAGLVLFSGPILFLFPSEAVIFLSFTQPYFILAHLCLILIFDHFLRFENLVSVKQKARSIIVILLAGLGLSLVHFFMNLLVAVILLLWLFFSFFNQSGRKTNWRPLVWFLTSSAPVSLYFVFLSQNPLFVRTWISQNIIPSFPPFLVLLWVGFIIFLIPFSFFQVKKNSKVAFLIIWFGCQFLFTYLPLRLQRRFVEGWWLSVVFLAVLGLRFIWQKNRKKSFSFQLGFLLCLFSLAGNLALVFTQFFLLADPVEDVSLYVSPAEVEAWHFLKPNCHSAELVLTDYPRGVYLPSKTGCRSFIGHPVITHDYRAKSQDWQKLFSGEWDSAKTNDFLKESKIKFVFLPHETAQKTALAGISSLKLIFKNEEFVIYER